MLSSTGSAVKPTTCSSQSKTDRFHTHVKPETNSYISNKFSTYLHVNS